MRIFRRLILASALLTVLSGQAPRAKDKDDGPAVVSKANERKSPFLRPPGADRYNPDATDWESIPPWRQTSFYGVRAEGRIFIYVVDCSGSMIDEERLVRAKRELKRSVLGLQAPQRFHVIFYNDRAITMPGTLPKAADLGSKGRFLHWL